MKNILLILITLMLFGCKETSTTPTELKVTTAQTEVIDTTVALQFINSYVANCNKEVISTVEFVAASPYATEKLKKNTQVLLDEAERLDPEMGLGFDPIFDAQDYPEEGFEIETTDPKTGYVVVRGKEWKDFRLAMVLKQENGKWLADGCGVVNVPKGKRIAR